MTPVFEASEDFAKRLDERDPLARFRERFALPTRHGEPVVYFNGNSLGLMPLAARELSEGDSVAAVILPELVAKRWWHALLHNQRALFIKRLLLFEPRVILSSVPYQLR